MTASQIMTRKSVDNNGVVSVYAEHDWPPETSFIEDVLRDLDPNIVSLDGDLLTIALANGKATYSLSPVDENGLKKGALVSGTFEPPPA